MSIKLKMTLWYTALMLIIIAAVIGFMLYMSGSVARSEAKNRLESTVSENIGKVRYEREILTLDPDFDYYKGGVYLIIYGDDKELISGYLPPDITESPSFSDRHFQTVKAEDDSYFVYDVKLSTKKHGDIWIRGVISAENTGGVVGSVVKLAVITLPFLMILAVSGGWYISVKAFRPVKALTKAADDISGGSDLSKRISLNKGKDEIHRLAATLDGMFDRLEKSFISEKQFTSDASHELRTPTSVILAECDLAMSEAETVEDYREALAVINRQAEKMSRLISQMLSYTRLEQGTAKIEFESADLSELASVVCEEQSLVSVKGISLTSEIEPDITAEIDVSMITSLIQNLISNAYKYGKENGHIFVSLKKSDGCAVFSVKDDGIGISKDEIDLIWKRFYRSDKSRNGDDGSMGLGLAISKQISDLHGASLTAVSDLGKGSEFIFKLPLKKN